MDKKDDDFGKRNSSENLDKECTTYFLLKILNEGDWMKEGGGISQRGHMYNP